MRLRGRTMRLGKSDGFQKFMQDWGIPIISAILVAFLVNKFIIFKIYIPSESMFPTLKVKDQLFATRVYNPEKLQRGDLIVFYSEERKELFIKRLIGLPNEEININAGIVSIDGQVLEESYVKNQEDFDGEYKVPEGKYFFLGDNRANSTDSRYLKKTYIDGEDIRGKAVIKIYPFSDFGFVNKDE